MTPRSNRTSTLALAATILGMTLLFTARAEQLLEPGPPQSLKHSEQVHLAALAEAKAAGGDPLRAATIQNNLAALYHQQGKYREAEALLREALTIREEFLGAENFEVAITLSNLAAMVGVSGKPALA